MKWGKTIVVVVCAVIVTALGIDAADTLTGADGTLLSQVIKSEKGKCGPGMVAVEAVPGVTCVDAYEVSPSEKCPVHVPNNMIESHKNTQSSECTADSKPEKIPWSFVTRDQALQLCARSGKRLPTSAEWYALTLGMTAVEASCNVNSKSLAQTGSYTACTVPSGAYDLVGNLWEWVSDDVIDGVHNTRTLPSSGYVVQVDNAGIAITTDTKVQELFDGDYFWSASTGAYGIVRGGYYDSGTDAGLYAVHADTPTNAASVGIGFRCVQ